MSGGQTFQRQLPRFQMLEQMGKRTMGFLDSEQVAARLLAKPGHALDTCKLVSCWSMTVLALEAELNDMLSSECGDQLPW